MLDKRREGLGTKVKSWRQCAQLYLSMVEVSSKKWLKYFLTVSVVRAFLMYGKKLGWRAMTPGVQCNVCVHIIHTIMYKYIYVHVWTSLRACTMYMYMKMHTCTGTQEEMFQYPYTCTYVGSVSFVPTAKISQLLQAVCTVTPRHLSFPFLSPLPLSQLTGRVSNWTTATIVQCLHQFPIQVYRNLRQRQLSKMMEDRPLLHTFTCTTWEREPHCVSQVVDGQFTKRILISNSLSTQIQAYTYKYKYTWILRHSEREKEGKKHKATQMRVYMYTHKHWQWTYW